MPPPPPASTDTLPKHTESRKSKSRSSSLSRRSLQKSPHPSKASANDEDAVSKVNCQCNCSASVTPPVQGNLLRGINKKTVRREGISICLLMFSSQKQTYYKETKWFKIVVFFIYNIFHKKKSEWKQYMANIVFNKHLCFQVKIKKTTILNHFV